VLGSTPSTNAAQGRAASGDFAGVPASLRARTTGRPQKCASNRRQIATQVGQRGIAGRPAPRPRPSTMGVLISRSHPRSHAKASKSAPIDHPYESALTALAVDTCRSDRPE
jgi:hypothetical protein